MMNRIASATRSSKRLAQRQISIANNDNEEDDEIVINSRTTNPTYPAEAYELFLQIEKKFDSLSHDIKRLKNLLFSNTCGLNNNSNHFSQQPDRDGDDMDFTQVEHLSNQFDDIQENTDNEIRALLSESRESDDKVVSTFQSLKNELIDSEVDLMNEVEPDGDGSTWSKICHENDEESNEPIKTVSSEIKINSNYKRSKSTKETSGYYCNICEKMYPSASQLSAHMRRHSDDRPFKCRACDKTFVLSGDLKRHSLTHTGVRPFKCAYCDKTFSLSYNLKNHMITHTGERPFVCVVCHKTFTQSHSLKSHLKIHDREQQKQLTILPSTSNYQI